MMQSSKELERGIGRVVTLGAPQPGLPMRQAEATRCCT
jgi:hypothetical protein